MPIISRAYLRAILREARKHGVSESTPRPGRCCVHVAGMTADGGSVWGFLNLCNGTCNGAICAIPFAFDNQSIARRAAAAALCRLGSRLQVQFIPVSLGLAAGGCLLAPLDPFLGE